MNNHILPKKQLDEIANYSDQHNLFATVHFLLQRLLIQKPVDPIQFMMDVLSKPEGIQESVVGIVVLGPPGFEQLPQKIAAELASRLGELNYVSSGQMVREAVEKSVTAGMQANQFVEAGSMIPDNIINGIVFHRLVDAELLEKGFVLEGYPRNKEQLHALNAKGIYPTHYGTPVSEYLLLHELHYMKCIVVLNVPEGQVAKSGNKTNTFHKTMTTFLPLMKPSWSNPQASSSLHYREFSVSDPRGDLTGVVDRIVTMLVSECGLTLDPYGAAATFIGRQFRGSPKMLKVAITGQNSTVVSERFAKKYGCVHVCVASLVESVENGNAAGDAIIAKLIMDRVLLEDCITQGFVLDGFPNNPAQAQALEDANLSLNHAFVLAPRKPEDIQELTAHYAKKHLTRVHAISLANAESQATPAKKGDAVVGQLFELVEAAIV